MLHSRYDFNYILGEPIKFTTKLLKEASEKEIQNKMWDMWLARYITMTPDAYISFDDFYDKAESQVEISTKSKEEIFAGVQKIIEADKKGR